MRSVSIIPSKNLTIVGQEGGANIGWEVPGTYDVVTTLHKLSVTVLE